MNRYVIVVQRSWTKKSKLKVRKVGLRNRQRDDLSSRGMSRIHGGIAATLGGRLKLETFAGGTIASVPKRSEQPTSRSS